MATQMMAQVLPAFNQPYDYRPVPRPELDGGHDLLVKVDAASYCHSDAVLASGQMKPSPPQFPHIGCHEFAGTVVQISENASPEARSFAIGDRVGVGGRGYHPCGESTCFECQDTSHPQNDSAGFSIFCPKNLINGINKHGGFAEYAVVDSRQAARLSDSISAVDAAPMMCGGITIFAAIRRCQLQAGQRLGIVGCGGGLGHLGLQMADAMNLKVVGVDAADGALSLSNSLGTKATIIDARVESADEVRQRIGTEDGKTELGETGLDAVIILPESQASFEYGTKLLRNHGLCVVVSFPEKGFNVSARDLVFRDIRIVGSLLGSIQTQREMMDFVAEHNIRAVKKMYSLAKLNDLVEEYHKGVGGKLVVDMSLQ